MDTEHYIALLERKLESKTVALEREKKQHNDAKLKVNELERCFRTNPQDRWYLVYLMEQLHRHEELHERQNHTIEQYRNHFAKFGKFYTDWLELHKDKINVVEKYE